MGEDAGRASGARRSGIGSGSAAAPHARPSPLRRGSGLPPLRPVSPRRFPPRQIKHMNSHFKELQRLANRFLKSIWYARYRAIPCAPGAEAKKARKPPTGRRRRAQSGQGLHSPEPSLRTPQAPAPRGKPGRRGARAGDGAESPPSPLPACGRLRAPPGPN